MAEIIDKGIFQKENGIWWAHSFLKPGFAFSLHTRIEAKAQALYDQRLKRMKEAMETAKL